MGLFYGQPPAACLCLLLSVFFRLALSASITREEVQSLKGDDTRLFRWDASPHTAERQAAGDCDKLETDAAEILKDPSSTSVEKQLAADYATLCITNNPHHRAKFSEIEGIHKAVIDMVGSNNVGVSYLACHLIYIAAYTNQKNHQTFFQEGAVEALAKVFMGEHSIPVQKMWAAAALQNLAASYCETPDDGTCWWEWTGKHQYVQLHADSPLHSDASEIRKAMMKVDGLIDHLIDHACHDPIDEEDEGVAMPGYTAVAGQHENNHEVATWAAIAALKNLALEPTSHPLVEDGLPCACFLVDSHDWLEESKAYGFLNHMRRDDPCYMRDDGMELCINHNFVDEGLYPCEAYHDATEEECQTNTDIFTGEKASEACCDCGGGTVVSDEGRDEL